jgi:phage baseplate assembly protein W
MKGLNVITGRAISGLDHLYQSIGQILSTPLASRIKRRPFGSDIPDLIDAPNNGATRTRLYAAIATALMRWDQHRYHVAQRESYAAVRAHYHSNGQGRRKSVIVGGENNHNVKVLPEDYATEAEARAAAEAEFARTQRSQATLDYTLARGQAEIFPELPVTVSGFKPEIDETPWLVKKVTHTLSDTGFTTALNLEVRDDPTTDRHRSHFRRSR